MEGGTDVAEMVLFSVDELPADRVSEDTLAGLENRKQAIRLPTGADGGYLLHLYVDEIIPEGIRSYCIQEDALDSGFQSVSGRIAFGGAESTFSAFEPNPFVREDSDIPPGHYCATAYRTEFPDDLVEEAVKDIIGAKGARALDFPGTIIMSSVGLTLALPILVSAMFGSLALAFGSALAAVVGGVLWYRSYTRTDEFKRLTARSHEVQHEYPSIVIRLNNASA